MIQHNKCKCAKCSQGFCHYCKPNKNVVTPRITEEGYRYLPGAGMVLCVSKNEDIFVSSCNSIHK